MLTRAAGFKPALGNLKPQGGRGRAGGKRVTAGTSSITFASNGQPLNVDWNAEELAVNGYLANVYVMRCCRLIAETISELPWVCGDDPTQPANYTKDAPLAKLLGPATPQAPGGPNQHTSARAFWIWTVCQYLVTGRFGWECQLDGPARNRQIIGLWPLVSAALAPKPSLDGSPKWFNGYQYTPATGIIDLTEEQVVYCWRPNIRDWRLPESVLQAAAVDIYISNSVNKYIANLLKRDLVATTMVVTPPFDEAEQRRAWQDQFLSEFTGVDRMGGTIFTEAEFDENDPAGARLIQVEKLAQTPVEAGLNQAQANAFNNICIALGTPRSLIGDASQRTYANACPRASELIRLANGERHMAKDLVGKTFDLLTSTPDGPKRVEGYASWANIEECFAVTTESGRRIEVNGRHPLFAGRHLTAAEYRARTGRKPGRPKAGTGDSPERRAVRNGVHVEQLGWTKVQDLSEGDLVAVTTEFPVEGNDPMTVDEATVLGALIGDGCSTGTNITLTSPDSLEVRTFTAAVERLGDRVTKYNVRREGACDTWGIAGGAVRKLLSQHGLLGLKGHHKFVPSSVFAARREVQVAFLQALYAADGCAHWAKGKTSGDYDRAMVDLTSVSETLVRDVQELLIRFGVSARIIPQKTSQKFPSFRLCIQVADEVLRFIDEVGIPAKSLMVKETRKVAQAQADRAPLRSRWRVLNVNKGLRWETIKSIESVGVDQHVCIEVPDGHTYLSTFWEHNSSEYKNFWTLTVLNLISELQDHINLNLAPRVGNQVGWFDLAKVSALQPPAVFAPPMITDVIQTGVAQPAQIANMLGIPAANATTDSDTSTVEIGEESSTPQPGRSVGAWDDRLLQRWIEWQGQPQEHINTWTLRGLAAPAKPKREHITVATRSSISTRGQGIEMAARIVNELTQMRADKLAQTVEDYLGTSYPTRVLGWVNDADWSGPKSIPLSQINLARRPGGRDRDKVKGIAKAIADNPDSPAAAPIVLVKTPGKDLYTIADGWHRTSAYKVLGKASIQAFVGVMDTDEGDWDVAMHNAKLNTDTAADDQRTESTGPAMNVRFDASPGSRLSVKELEAIADKLSLL